MNDTDVQATNTDFKPKLHQFINLFFNYDWLITMLFQGQQDVYLVKQGSAAHDVLPIVSTDCT